MLTSSKGDAALGLVANITQINRILIPNEVIEIHRKILQHVTLKNFFTHNYFSVQEQFKKIIYCAAMVSTKKL